MKYILHILTLIIGIITTLLVWIYIQRAQLDYNAEGLFFSSENGVVYHEQAKEVYGIFGLFGLVLTILLTISLIKRRKQNDNKT